MVTVSVQPPLKFVQDNEFLIQKLTPRAPADRLYPKVKQLDELNSEDIAALIKNSNLGRIKELLESDAPALFERPCPTNGDKKRLLDCVVSKLHDVDGELLKILHSRVASSEGLIHLTDLNYNFMLQNACNFNQHDFLAQLLFEATVTGRKIELQTYIKVIVTLYVDMAHLKTKARQDLNSLLFLLFTADCPSERD